MLSRELRLTGWVALWVGPVEETRVRGFGQGLNLGASYRWSMGSDRGGILRYAQDDMLSVRRIVPGVRGLAGSGSRS